MCSSIGSSLRQEYYYDCVVDVYYSSDPQAALAPVTGFADYCQDVLDLVQWPAQSLCTYFPNTFPDWVGTLCDKPCYYGSKSPDNPDVCACATGYWNKSCDEQCPGGAAYSCHGHGACDKLTGTCDCPINKLNTGDCSTCSTGWLGSDCTVTYTEPVASRTKAFAHVANIAVVHNLDGLAFRFIGTGQYHLLNLNVNLFIQGKFIRCYTQYSCITFLGFRLGDPTNGYTSISINALVKSRLSVSIDGASTSLDRMMFFYGFTIERLASTQLSIIVSPATHILISSIGPYLSVSASLPIDLVPVIGGLLSGGRTSTSADAISHVLSSPGYSTPLDLCSNTNIQNPSNTEVPGYSLPLSTATAPNGPAQMNYTEVSVMAMTAYAELWTVDPCDNLISYTAEDYEKQETGGFALKFVDSALFATFSADSVIGLNVTIELLLKTNTSAGGTILSYAAEQTFVLESGSTLSVLYGQTEYTTNLTIEENVWNKVLMTYEGETGQLDLYCFSSSGEVLRHLLELPLNILTRQGTLALGQWQPPNSGESHEARPSFVGYLDNVMIWSIVVDPTVVQETWDLSVLSVEPLLSAAWLLDEGEGTSGSDIKDGLMFSLPPDPWSAPLWVPSSTLGMQVDDIDILTYTFHSSVLQSESNATCAALLTDISNNCPGLPGAYVEMLNVMCLQQVSTRMMLADAYDLLFKAADACEVDRENSKWPGDQLCQEATDASKPIQRCSRTCVFGVEQQDGTCLCDAGYHVSNCTGICPGGSQTPCNAHGKCEEGTSCQCDANWKGDASCGSCSTNWTASDCSILISSPVTNRQAYVTPTALYKTFDQAHFSLPNTAGAFVVFENSDVEIQIHQTLCEYGVCVTAMAFQMSNVTLSIHPGQGDNSKPYVFLNDVKFETTVVSAYLGNDMTLIFHNTLGIEMKVGNHLSVHANVIGQFLHVTIEAEQAQCQFATGIFGSCDNNVSNDILVDMVSGDSEDHAALIQASYKQPLHSSLFNGQATNLVGSDLSLGYALSFNNSAGRTVPLSHQFSTTTRRKRSLPNYNQSPDVTVSLLVRPQETDGIIMSYGKTNTFAVENAINVTLHCGSNIIVTNAQLVNNKWNQIVLALDRSANILHFYVFDHVSSLVYQELTQECPDFMELDGRITLGDWQPAPDGTKREVSKFIGEIDEFSVWLTHFPHTVVYQMYHLNVQPTAFKDYLVYLYKFAEGLGHTAHEIVKDRDLHLPHVPWPHPTWMSSDLELADLSSTNVITDIPADVELACTEFFADVTISSTCSPSLGSDVYALFYSLCSKSVHIDGAFYTILTFVQVCQNSVGSSLDLTTLCGADYAPSWIEVYCHTCGFGQWTGTECQCYTGFWGVLCDQACPGVGVAHITAMGTVRQTAPVCVMYITQVALVNCLPVIPDGLVTTVPCFHQHTVSPYNSPSVPTYRAMAELSHLTAPCMTSQHWEHISY